MDGRSCWGEACGQWRPNVRSREKQRARPKWSIRTPPQRKRPIDGRFSSRRGHRCELADEYKPTPQHVRYTVRSRATPRKRQRKRSIRAPCGLPLPRRPGTTSIATKRSFFLPSGAPEHGREPRPESRAPEHGRERQSRASHRARGVRTRQVERMHNGRDRRELEKKR
jgi:hypothetical protein